MADTPIELNIVQNRQKPTNEQLNQLVDPKNLDKLKQHFTSIDNLLKKLDTDKENGIAKNSIQERIGNYGDNTLPPPRTKTFLQFFFAAFREKMVIFLLFAAGVSVAAGVYETINGETTAWLEGVAILAAIAVIVLVNSVNDWRKQARFRMLDDTSKSLRTVKIVRDGQSLEVSLKEIVVGDIVFVSMGEVIPCDGVLVENRYVKTDESSMTGESDEIAKDDSDPFMLSGTTVADGSGKMVVIAVGTRSLQGRAMAGLRIDPPKTPLQIKLGELASRLAKFGLLVAAVTLTALIAIFFVKGSPGDLIHGLVQVILVGISIVVMAIPEGLPLAVTLSLAYATINMLKDNNLVRHLSACETMGGATTICSDKTGTLTVNKMTIVAMHVFNTDYTREDVGNIEKEPTSMKRLVENTHLERLVNNICINSQAEERIVSGETIFKGSKTDIAMLELLMKFGYDYKSIRKEADIIEMIPFSSERKRMTTIVRESDGDFDYVKGASEIILNLCTHYVHGDGDGEKRELDNDYRKGMENKITEFAKASLRTICCAYRPHAGKGKENDSGYILLALFGIEDPLRGNAAQSIKECQSAGVVVRMVTGDNALTARSIAKQCGIVQDEEKDIVLEGPHFRTLSQDEMDAIIPQLRVLARSSPNDKLILVNALMRLGETVAVTGDGANDAPALKNSHVGFSMGLAGTEVAKEASDIVLLDDNFASLVKAISWGRAVYSGIQKFITFQLSVNFSAVIITIVTAVTSSLETGIADSGLTTLQILMINLVADSLAAMALSTDKPTPQLLKNKPHRQSEHIITNNMWKMIIGQSIYQTAVGLLVYYVGPMIWGYDRLLRKTMVFNTFVYMVLFNELNCRSITRDFNVFRGITKNKFFIPLFVIGLVVQFPIVTWLGIIFDTVPLTWWQWIISIGLGTGSLVVGALVRITFTREKSL